MSRDETKYKFFGLIKAAIEQEQELDYEAVSQMLEVKVPTLKVWFKQFRDQAKEDSVLKLVDLDKVMVEKLAAAIEDEASELDTFRINPVTGVIEQIDNTQAQPNIKQFKDSVTGLKLLSEELQATAGSLVCQIATATQDEVNPRDLANLANALVSIQNAFFNKPTTNIQVNTLQQNGGGEDSMLSAFKKGLKN